VVESDALPYTDIYGGGTEQTYAGNLQLDGYDAEKGIGFAFVSKADVAAWHKDTGMASTVASYDMQGTARRLAEGLKGTAVFYDPGPDYSQIPQWGSDDWDKEVEIYIETQKARMEEDLRAQVMDFIIWLQAQGVI